MSRKPGRLSMKSLIRAGLLSGALLIAGLPTVATAASHAAAKPMTPEQRLAMLEKEMSRLKRLIDNRALLELVQRVEDLSQEVSELRGQLEQQNYDMAGLKKRQRELYLDIDRRLRDLENTSSRGPASAPQLPSVAPAATAATPPAAPVGHGKPETAPPKPVVPAVSVAPGAAANTVSDERAAYQKAFDLLKEGRYQRANAAFREFLARYPRSSYAGNAQYWLGESLYVTRKFKQAAEEFQKVLKSYPNSNKAPDAMLKLGYTWYELRQFDAARAMLKQLGALYPNSTAARLAKKRLDRMRKEGV
jgi:tol-pal system protein YbgF